MVSLASSFWLRGWQHILNLTSFLSENFSNFYPKMFDRTFVVSIAQLNILKLIFHIRLKSTSSSSLPVFLSVCTHSSYEFSNQVSVSPVIFITFRLGMMLQFFLFVAQMMCVGIYAPEMTALKFFFFPLEQHGEHSSLLRWVCSPALLLMNMQMLQLWTLPTKFIN